MLVQNDNLGGGGSLFDQLKDIAVNGISRAVDGTLARKFPLTSFNETVTTTADGSVKPSATPSNSASTASAAKSLLSNPITIAVGISLAATLLLVVAFRR